MEFSSGDGHVETIPRRSILKLEIGSFEYKVQVTGDSQIYIEKIDGQHVAGDPVNIYVEGELDDDGKTNKVAGLLALGKRVWVDGPKDDEQIKLGKLKSYKKTKHKTH